MEEQGPRPAVASFALERHTGQVALPWEGRGAAKGGERKRSGRGWEGIQQCSKYCIADGEGDHVHMLPHPGHHYNSNNSKPKLSSPLTHPSHTNTHTHPTTGLTTIQRQLCHHTAHPPNFFTPPIHPPKFITLHTHPTSSPRPSTHPSSSPCTPTQLHHPTHPPVAIDQYSPCESRAHT